MNALYNWLLQNTGNEGNYLTILNTQPHTEGEEITELSVMARTKNFDTVNVAIKASPPSDKDKQTGQEAVEQAYQFDDLNQVIAYLSGGQEPDASGGSGKATFFVYVTKPLSGAGSVTFPGQQ